MCLSLCISCFNHPFYRRLSLPSSPCPSRSPIPHATLTLTLPFLPPVVLCPSVTLSKIVSVSFSLSLRVRPLPRSAPHTSRLGRLWP